MTLLHDPRRDARRAWRSLRRSPIVTGAAVLSIGLGAGAATTVFSIVDAALFRPPPFARAGGLDMLYMTHSRANESTVDVRWSWPRFRELAATQRSFERVASFSSSTAAFTDGEAEPIEGEFVSSSYFRLLALRPAIGRVFDASSDDVATAQPVVVLGYDVWQTRFGGRETLIGRVVSVNDVRLTVIGVLPKGFKGLSGRASIWMPAPVAVRATYADYLVTNQNFISVVGRLRPGVSLGQARAELALLGGRIDRRFPLEGVEPGERVAATAVGINDARIDPSTRRPLVLLLAGAACLLLLSCANVAGLLLGQAAAKRRDIALQAALGAPRSCILRQLLVEDSLLGVAGAAIGVAIALALTARAGVPAAAFRARNFYGALGEFAAPRVDARVLAFSLALSAATPLLFGLLPAMQSTRVDLRTALTDGGRGVVAAGWSRRRRLSRWCCSSRSGCSPPAFARCPTPTSDSIATTCWRSRFVRRTWSIRRRRRRRSSRACSTKCGTCRASTRSPSTAARR